MSDKTTTRGVLALVFGILAITGTCPCIGSFIAILLADRSGVGRAGAILGWISLLLWLVIAVFAFLVMGVSVVADAAN